MKRNGEIDVLRFVFIIVILLCHFSSTFKTNYFIRGYMGNEFFFLVTGFLMAQKAFNLKGLDISEIPSYTWNLIRNKVIVFYPYFLSAILVELVVRRVIILDGSYKTIFVEIYKIIPTLSLTFTGITKHTGLYVGNTWFLSSMIIALFILYPIFLRNYEWASKYLAPVFCLFGLGYLDAVNLFSTWSKWIGLTYNSILHALTVIALGGSLFALVDYLKNKYGERADGIKKIFLTSIKFFVIYW